MDRAVFTPKQAPLLRLEADFHSLVLGALVGKPGLLQSFFFFFLEMEFRSCYPGWSAMMRSRLTATFASQVQAILLLSASGVAGIAGMHNYNTWLIFLYFFY